MTDRERFTMAEWSAALRAGKRRRRRVKRWAVGIGALSCLLGLTILAPPSPWLVWNVSASAPVGLYGVGTVSDLARGDMVIARVPIHWRLWAARRHYIPANVPLVKRVAAVPGDLVCAAGRALWVNGRFVVERLMLDGTGRAMPSWSGCMRLQPGEHLLLMGRPDSFDGRYFGVSGKADLVGKAVLLWQR